MLAQWIAGTIIAFLIVVVIWAMANPSEERTKIVTGFFGVLGFLLGAGLQEFRVQDQEEKATSARAEIVEVRQEVSIARLEAVAAREDAQIAQREAFESYARLQKAERLVAAGTVTGDAIVLPEATVRELERLTREQPQIFRERPQP